MNHTLTDNGSTPVYRAAKALVRGAGDFGSGTVTLEYRVNPEDAWTTSTVIYDDTFEEIVEFPVSVELRLSLADAASPVVDLGIIPG